MFDFGGGFLRYTYAYKTSDGERHEATMVAESREAVFAELRKQGIKAIKVVAEDGSKANGEVRGVRKRILVLSALCLVLSAVVVIGVVVFALGTRRHAPGTDASTPRHQIYGDPVIVEDFERGDFGKVLTNRADQMLAWFAQPGRLMCPKGTDPRRCADEFAKAVFPSTVEGPSPSSAECTFAPSKYTCPVAPDDSREVRELKQIVNGMHEEMTAYLANGNGTPRSFWRRLLERTQQEMQIYERTRRELEKEKSPAVWEQKNDAIRRLGLRTIPNPKEAE